MLMTFVYNEEKLSNMKTCSLNELLTRHVGWTMVQCTQQFVTRMYFLKIYIEFGMTLKLLLNYNYTDYIEGNFVWFEEV